MQKPNKYDETEVYKEFKKLPKGGYVCKIKKIEEGRAKTTGAQMLLIYLDIADGEYKNLFMERYQNSTLPNPKWGCIAYQLVFDSTTGDTNPRLKGFLTAVEESNAGFVVEKTWGDNFVKYYKDKLVGFVFGDDHFLNLDGKEVVVAKPRFAISVDKIKKGDFKIPADTYQQGTGTEGKEETSGFDEMTVDDDDMPF